MEVYANCSVMNGNVPVTCPSGNCHSKKVKNSTLTFDEVSLSNYINP